AELPPGGLGRDLGAAALAVAAAVAAVRATAGGEDQEDGSSSRDEREMALVHVVPLRRSEARRRCRAVAVTGPGGSGPRKHSVWRVTRSRKRNGVPVPAALSPSGRWWRCPR